LIANKYDVTKVLRYINEVNKKAEELKAKDRVKSKDVKTSKIDKDLIKTFSSKLE
jgi:hypothetical protein